MLVVPLCCSVPLCLVVLQCAEAAKLTGGMLSQRGASGSSRLDNSDKRGTDSAGPDYRPCACSRRCVRAHHSALFQHHTNSHFCCSFLVLTKIHTMLPLCISYLDVSSLYDCHLLSHLSMNKPAIIIFISVHNGI